MDVKAIAGQVATELGDEWAASAGVWGGGDAYLVGPDDMRIHVRAGGYQHPGKFRISGSLPDGWHEHAPRSYETDAPSNPDIGVATTKTAKQIAGDITRRLLPGYREYLDATRARKARSDAHHDGVEQAGDRLIALSGGRARWDDPNRHSRGGKPVRLSEIDLFGVPGVSYGKATVHGDGGVRLAVNLTAEGAEAFFRAMGKLAE